MFRKAIPSHEFPDEREDICPHCLSYYNRQKTKQIRVADNYYRCTICYRYVFIPEFLLEPKNDNDLWLDKIERGYDDGKEEARNEIQDS